MKAELEKYLAAEWYDCHADERLAPVGTPESIEYVRHTFALPGDT